MGPVKFQHNIYYHPEKLGFEIIADVDIAEMYSFNMLVVWREKATGKLYYALDSGCSCPSPFEWVTDTDDLTLIAPLTFDHFLRNMSQWLSGRGQQEIYTEIRNKVKAALNAISKKGGTSV